MDLNTRVTDLEAAVGEIETGLKTLKADLLAAVEANDMTAVQAAADKIGVLTERLRAANVAARDTSPGA